MVLINGQNGLIKYLQTKKDLLSLKKSKFEEEFNSGLRGKFLLKIFVFSRY